MSNGTFWRALESGSRGCSLRGKAYVRVGSRRRAPGNHVVDDEDHDGAHHSDEHAVEVEAGNSGGAELREEKPAHNRSHNSKHDVQEDAFAAPVDDLAGNETGDESEHEPSYD